MQKGDRLLSSPHISAAEKLQNGIRISLTLTDRSLRPLLNFDYGAAGRLHN